MDIQIDLAGMKIKDLELFEKAVSRNMSQTELLGLLDRVVVGGARELPLTELNNVMDALTKAMEKLSNPKDAEGKA